MQIAIDTAVLKSVRAMTEDKAQQIIEQTNRVRINEDTPIEPERQKDGSRWKRRPTSMNVYCSLT